MRTATRSRSVLSSGPKAAGAVRVDVDLADDLALVDDGDDDLAPRRREAGEVAVVRIDVVDDLGLPAGGRGAADALADRDAHVVGRLRALPGPEHEVGLLDEVDPDPGVVVEAVVQDLDCLAKDLIRLGFAVDDPVDRLERARVVAHDGTASSRSAPSKSATTCR